MKINTPVSHPQVKTHEGAPAKRISKLAELRRSTLSCLLWEDSFYEDGVSIADRISQLAAEVDPKDLAALAVEIRSQGNLRHVPLILLTALAKTGSGTPVVSQAIVDTIQRADELAEFVAIYAKQNGVTPDKVKPKLSAQVKKGLSAAFGKFNAYQLAKYNRDGAVKLRDVLFLTHPKPKDEAQAEVWKKLVDGTLESPDTWEVALSGGADKKETFERLLSEGKLGYMALLRNLRNMTQSGVDRELIVSALNARKGAERILPFRYVAAARSCPEMSGPIDKSLLASLADLDPLPGLTVVLVDHSGSMDCKLSGKSDLTRFDAAATLASVIPGDVRVFSFNDTATEVPAYKGLAGIEAIRHAQPWGGTMLGAAINTANKKVPKMDRLIVITDEQSQDRVGAPVCDKAYMINVASHKNGVGYGKDWTHIDGFSENVIKFIAEFEKAK